MGVVGTYELCVGRRRQIPHKYPHVTAVVVEPLVLDPQTASSQIQLPSSVLHCLWPNQLRNNVLQHYNDDVHPFGFEDFDKSHVWIMWNGGYTFEGITVARPFGIAILSPGASGCVLTPGACTFGTLEESDHDNTIQVCKRDPAALTNEMTTMTYQQRVHGQRQLRGHLDVQPGRRRLCAAEHRHSARVRGLRRRACRPRRRPARRRLRRRPRRRRLRRLGRPASRPAQHQ